MMQWARERGYDVRKTLCAVGDEVHEVGTERSLLAVHFDYAEH